MRILVLILALLVCLGVSAAAGDLPDSPGAVRNLQLLASRNWAFPIPAVQPPPAAAMLASPEPSRKVMDRNFLLLGALTFGLTAADIELTQHCLEAKTCVELNPTLPHSRWGMYAVNTPVNLAVMYFAYRRKASGKRGWWIAPLIDTGIHGVGIGSNVRFAW